MDPRLLKYYNTELQYIREMGGEFAKEYPKIAGRLGLDGFDCSDPYVERLLEGFSFLSARLHLKIDSDFSRFTQHLLEMIYPHYLSPIPSMAVVQMHSDLNDPGLAEGMVIPKETILRSTAGKNEPVQCEYRTSHDVTMWPLEVSEASYVTNIGALPKYVLSRVQKIRSGIRIKLKATAGLTINQLSLKNLCLYIKGSDELPMHIYEQIFANCAGIAVQSPDNPDFCNKLLRPSSLKRFGFENDQALIPYGGRSFHGYRLLQEYFAFPERFMFFEISDLESVFQKCEGEEIELLILLNKTNPFLENRVDASNFLLHCVSTINLFPKKADRIFVSNKDHEYHIVPERTRPLDYEVYSVNAIIGHGKKEYKQPFFPFYSTNDSLNHSDQKAYFTIRREPRVLSSNQRKYGPRSSYIGSETFVSLVDSNEAPFSSELRELELHIMCTNRDLPLHMPTGKGTTDFRLVSGLPVETVRCVAGPTTPKPSHAYKETSWRLISHLTLNYLSLIDNDTKKNAESLKDILNLYGDMSEQHIKKQIEGITEVSSTPITRRLPLDGPIAFGRGLEIAVQFDESAFEGQGSFLLGAILDSFFKKYVSINSFIETKITTMERGELIRWPMRIGRRQII